MCFRCKAQDVHITMLFRRRNRGRASPAESLSGIEEGGVTNARPPPPRRWRGVLVLVLMVGGGWIGALKTITKMDQVTEQVFTKISAALKAEPEAICLSSHHVGERGLRFILFSEEPRLRMMDPRVLRSGPGSQIVRIREAITLVECRGLVREATRDTKVVVQYRVKGSFWTSSENTRTVTLIGNQAFCVQHMLQLFSNTLTCD